MGQEPDKVAPADPPADPPVVPAAVEETANPPAHTDAGDETAEMLPRKVVEEARREAAKYRTRAQEAEARLREIDDATKTEAEKALQRAEEAEARAAELERRDVARDAGLPVSWADRLRGDSRDELLADAQQLAKEFNRPANNADWDAGPRPPAPGGLPDDADPLTRMAHAYGAPRK